MKLLQRFRGVCAQRHYSGRTIECYEMWIRQFLSHFRNDGSWRHPRELRGSEVGEFLTHLAQHRRLSASSQNQATCAIVFLYKQVLADELGEDHVRGWMSRRSAVGVRHSGGFARQALDESREHLGNALAMAPGREHLIAANHLQSDA